MNAATPDPPSPDADADARFAAYLDDLAAYVDDPECGEDCREILNEDPQTQRAWFELSEAMAAGTASTMPLSFLITALVATACLLAVGFFMLRVVARVIT
jgi:hypothetical protein